MRASVNLLLPQTQITQQDPNLGSDLPLSLSLSTHTHTFTPHSCTHTHTHTHTHSNSNTHTHLVPLKINQTDSSVLYKFFQKHRKGRTETKTVAYPGVNTIVYQSAGVS